MNLVLFDLDGTLIEGDSDHAFCEFLITLGWVDADAFHQRNEHFFKQYQAGCLDIHGYIEFATAPWRQRSQAEQALASQRFMTEVMQPQLRSPARELVRAHQKAGDVVAIVTATNEFITRPIADAFGVPDLIAVNLERDASGAVTGRIAGLPSFQAGKITRVDEWLATQGQRWQDFDRTVFYSDSTNDLPLLERASEPVATNPGPALETIAGERGWRILRLFS
ncbi:HAD family hydrolase [Aquabacterium sp.]|uniref:HAD family hydrolase n=1 Tax=Aquabacterium sp. TaxID=1872578 RepID=UPI002CD815EC|nr:HAD family phosphatase [Aquabacterium sp.]HSW02978.1 HAD family phosphatase [Aquabacterium sp.]